MTGKNVPENRNNGIIPNRNTRANDVSLDTVIAHVSIGAAKASPVSTATGTAASTHGDVMAPNAAMTTRKMAEFMASRMIVNSRCP